MTESSLIRSPLGLITGLKLHIPWVTPSGKNRPILTTRDGRPFMLPNKETRLAKEWIREEAIRLLNGEEMPLADDDLYLGIWHNVRQDTMDAVIQSIRNRPKGKTGRKRDLINLSIVIPDALQGLLYRNDNAVSEAYMVRRMG